MFRRIGWPAMDGGGGQSSIVDECRTHESDEQKAPDEHYCSTCLYMSSCRFTGSGRRKSLAARRSDVDEEHHQCCRLVRRHHRASPVKVDLK